MLIVIIPDVHEEIKRLRWIMKIWAHADRFVFVGDYFDSWKGLTWRTRATAEWIRDNINNPKMTFLLGNHCLHYAFPKVHGLRCSGYDPIKQKIIDEVFKDNVWKHMKLYEWVDGWLISHAGLHPRFLHPIDGFTPERLEELAQKALILLNARRMDDFVDAGFARDNRKHWAGGITWLDWAREFKPIDGLNQIVGHSWDEMPRTNHTETSQNHCIDTEMHYVAVIRDGKITIKSTFAPQ